MADIALGKRIMHLLRSSAEKKKNGLKAPRIGRLSYQPTSIPFDVQILDTYLL